MPSIPAAPLLRFTCANASFRFSRSTTASIDGPATAGRSRLAFAARASDSWAAALLPAFFRPHLAMMPLRFTNPSPSSGWIEDFHLQAVVHPRHTTKPPPAGPAAVDRSEEKERPSIRRPP